MSGVILYALLFGLYATAVAALLDGPMRRAGRPTRFIWFSAMALSVIAPVVAMVARPLTARVEGSTVSVLRSPITVTAVTPSTAPAAESAPRIVHLAALAEERIESGSIEWLAVLGVVAMALVLVVDVVRVTRLRRRAREATIDGVSMLVSPDYGPAVLGVIRPRVIVPKYFTELPAEERALAIEHELAHLRAHDGRLLAAAFLLVALVPWNVALWYQLARLRLAIEIDCDRTVLDRTHASVASYGSLLVDTASRMRRASPLAAGLAERRAHLERRIEAMTERRVPLANRRNLGLGAAAIVVIAAACITPGGRVSLEPPGARAPAYESYGDSIIVYQFRELPDGFEDTRWSKGPARDLPTSFKADTSQRGEFSFSRDACPSSLVDARNGAKLRLITTGYDNAAPTGDPSLLRGKGLYRVDSAGRYGVKGKNTYLQVQCRTRPPTWMAQLPADTRVRLDSGLRARLGLTADSMTGNARQMIAYFGLGLTAGATDTAAVRKRVWAAGQAIWEVYGSTVGLGMIGIQIEVTGTPVDPTAPGRSFFHFSFGHPRAAGVTAPIASGQDGQGPSPIAFSTPLVSVSKIRGSGNPRRLFVPLAAVIEREGRPLVFVVRADTARWIYVTRGRMTGSEVEILPDAGSRALYASEGELVVIAGQAKLVHGMPVRISPGRGSKTSAITISPSVR